jgi:hypothetical protein
LWKVVELNVLAPVVHMNQRILLRIKVKQVTGRCKAKTESRITAAWRMFGVPECLKFQ